MSISITKPQLITGLGLLTLLPWFTGGRQPVAILVNLFLVVLGLFLIWRLPDKPIIDRSNVTLAAIALALLAASSLIWSVNRYDSIHWLAVLVISYGVFAIAGQSHTEKTRHEWLNGYLLISAIFAVIGFVLYLTGGYPRLTTTFYWANPAAAFFIPAAILSLWQWVTGKNKLHLATFAITAGALWLTDSRGAVLVLALITLAVGLKVRLKPPAWARVFLALFLSFMLATVFNLSRSGAFHQKTAVPGARFAEAVKGESTSAPDRLLYLKSAWLIWKDHPILGTGAGTYPAVHPFYQQRVISASHQAHNFYAQTVAELGLLGAAALALLMLSLLWQGYQAAKKVPSLWPWLVALVALLMHFGLDIDSDYSALVMLAASLAGIVLANKKRRKTASYPSLLLGAMALIALPVISLYQSQLATNYASAAQSNGDYDIAADYYNKAHSGVAYDPDTLTGEGINRLALARQNQNAQTNLALAKLRAETAIKLDRFDAQQHFLLARILLQQGQVQPATVEYRQAIRLDPYNQPDYYNDLAQVLSSSDTAAGLQVANDGLAKYPDQVLRNRSADTDLYRQVSNLYTTRALILLRLGDSTKAADDLKTAYAINAKNISAKQLLEQISSH